MTSANTTNRRPLILSVSRDPMLLASRNALLNDSGYDVVSTLNDDEALNIFRTCDIDAVVLGDSIAWAERTNLIHTIRTLNERVPIIVLKLTNELDPPGATASMGSLDGPRVLLNLIADALRNRSAHAA